MPPGQDYYLLINNAPHGPYTVEQMQDWIKSQSSQADLNSVSFAIAGSSNWQPVSAFSATLLPQILPPPVLNKKTGHSNPSQCNNSEILEVAKYQKNILWLIIVNLLTFWMVFVSILTGIIGIIFIYRLAKVLKSSLDWLYIVLSFIPVVNVIALLLLNRKATVVLRAHGIRVGLMGANQEDLSKLSLS